LARPLGAGMAQARHPCFTVSLVRRSARYTCIKPIRLKSRATVQRSPYSAGTREAEEMEHADS